MKAKGWLVAAVLALGSFVVPAHAAFMRVVVVETADVAAYQATVAKVDAAMHRLGGKQTLRMWRARFAGPDAGAVVVSIEYPDIVNFAETDAKAGNDAELKQLLKELDGLRKIVSDSLYQEVK